MKTNIPIEINDEQRLYIGQKYHKTKSKKLITRKELNTIVQYFIRELLARTTSTKETIDAIVSENGWTYYYNDRPVTKEEFHKRSAL
mgnify:CR=1 FL=1